MDFISSTKQSPRPVIRSNEVPGEANLPRSWAGQMLVGAAQIWDPVTQHIEPLCSLNIMDPFKHF